MPLPKPSKTVSRRIKKLKPPLFTASLTEHQNACKLPSKPQQRERRVRVICTDPDATDSSSDEEGEDAPFRPKLTHKRLVCEICLPASSPNSSCDVRQEETSLGTVISASHGEDALFRLKRTNKRLAREICLPASPAISSCVSQQDETSMGTVIPSSPCLAVEKRKSFKVARKDVGLQDLYERTDEPSVGSWVDNSNASLVGAEEFSQFLSEFLGIQEEGCIPAWDDELDLLDDGMFDNALDFEFDLEPATWINSVQGLV